MDKNRIMMIIIIALLVVLLGSIVGVLVLVRGYVSSTTPEVEAREEIKDVSYTQLQFFEISTISTNLATGVDKIPRTAKVKIAYSVITDEEESEEMIALLTDKQLVIQSLALDTIRSKTYEEMMRSDSQQMLEDEILKKLQSEFQTNLIHSVLVFDVIAV